MRICVSIKHIFEKKSKGRSICNVLAAPNLTYFLDHQSKLPT